VSHCYIFTQFVISTEFEKLYHKVLLSYFVFYLLCVSLSLSQAFIAVEKSFFESIDHIFAEKTTIQLQLPEVTTVCAKNH